MSVEVQPPGLQGLAEWLESDIRRKGLAPGDRYLTAEEAGRLLSVSTCTASRAMNLLAKRMLLVRRRRQGTFVGPQAPAAARANRRCVHFLTFLDEAPPNMGLPVGEMLAGLRVALPSCTLKSHLGPTHDALAHIRNEVKRASHDEGFGGFVLSLGTRDVQRFLSASGLPAVVHGGVYPGVDLPSVQHDQKQIGRLMAREAICAGHRSLVFINRETWRRGDGLALDGILQAIAEAGLGAGTLQVRNASFDYEVMREDFAHLLAEIGGPAAFLCRSGHHTEALVSAAEQRGLHRSEDACIIWDATDCSSTSFSSPLLHAFVASELGIAEQYRLLGDMLVRKLDGAEVKPSQVLVPVKLVVRPRPQRRSERAVRPAAAGSR